MKNQSVNPREIKEFFEQGHKDTLAEAERLHDLLTNLRFEGKISLGKNLREIDEVLRFFCNELTLYMQLEEDFVFPFLETHLPKLESVIRLLSAEHKEFKVNLKIFKLLLKTLPAQGSELSRTRSIEEIREKGTYLIYLIRNHIQAENESIHKVMAQELNSDEKRELFRKISSHDNDLKQIEIKAG